MSDHGRYMYLRKGCRCEVCTKAATQYTQKMRAKHGYGPRHSKLNKARDAALRRLAKMYPNDVERLVNEERAKRGLPLLGEVPVGRPRKAS